MPTLAHVAGYEAVPRVAGIKLDGISQWHALVSNSTSPRTSVVLDVESPRIVPRWGDVGAGVVRIGRHKLHTRMPNTGGP